MERERDTRGCAISNWFEDKVRDTGNRQMSQQSIKVKRNLFEQCVQKNRKTIREILSMPFRKQKASNTTYFRCF